MAFKHIFTPTQGYLHLALAASVAAHVLLIVGLNFALPGAALRSASVDITLVRQPSDVVPDEAKSLAQANQHGEDRRTYQMPERVDHLPANVQSGHQQEKAAEVLVADAKQGSFPQVDARISQLQAKLSAQLNDYQSLPSERIVTSASALALEEADYLQQWITRIEAVGNLHFPKEALRRQLTGKLRMEVVVNEDGSIESTRLRQSSGYSVLDNSARQIIHMAAPFKAFPAALRKKYQRLIIIRTWHFTISGLTTSQ